MHVWVKLHRYPKTAFKREPDTDPDIRNGFIDISGIQTFGKTCTFTLHNHSRYDYGTIIDSFIIVRSIFSAICAMTPSLSVVYSLYGSVIPLTRQVCQHESVPDMARWGKGSFCIH